VKTLYTSSRSAIKIVSLSRVDFDLYGFISIRLRSCLWFKIDLTIFCIIRSHYLFLPHVSHHLHQTSLLIDDRYCHRFWRPHLPSREAGFGHRRCLPGSPSSSVNLQLFWLHQWAFRTKYPSYRSALCSSERAYLIVTDANCTYCGRVWYHDRQTDTPEKKQKSNHSPAKHVYRRSYRG